MVDVKGKWALVTGASRGIGRLAAVFLAQRGCNIIAQGRTKEHSADLVEELKAMGVSACAVAAELSDAESVAGMLEEIDRAGMDVDIVLNNAGDAGRLSDRVPEDARRRLRGQLCHQHDRTHDDLLSLPAEDAGKRIRKDCEYHQRDQS